MSKWQDKIIYVKWCIQRAYSYAIIFNVFAMAYLVLGRLIDKGFVPKWVDKYNWALAIVLFVVMVVVGAVEDRVGLARAEHELGAERMGLLKKEVAKNYCAEFKSICPWRNNASTCSQIRLYHQDCVKHFKKEEK